MINEVYQMCLALLNKNNYGYMTPMEFNLFAYQAQLDIFEDLFYDYNMQITKQGGRRASTGYPDIPKGIEETISIFSETAALRNTYTLPPLLGWNTGAAPEVSNKYNLPSHYYLINKLFHCPNLVATIPFNDVTGTGADYEDRANWATFAVGGTWVAQTGDYVVNLLPDNNPLTEYPVSTVVGETTPATGMLRMADRISWMDGVVMPSFQIYQGLGRSGNNVREIEKLSQKRIFNLAQSNLTRPTNMFPAYVLSSDEATGNQYAEVYPVTLNNYGMVLCQYIRYPKIPNWTYTQVGTRAVFNQSAVDYQDFELPEDNFQDLVARILQYGGLTIREVQAVQYGQSLEAGESTEEMTK